MNSALLNTIQHGKAEDILPTIADNSIDVVLTDPPYFLETLDTTWDTKRVNMVTQNQHITSLPAGMAFNRKQGKALYEWYSGISEELFRVLKPGGFFFSFSSPRLFHRMASAVDDAGFDIRDMYLWLYTQTQVKAMSLARFIEQRSMPISEKKNLLRSLHGWKTPQVKSCYEPIVVAQKPIYKTYLDTVLQYGVGLINSSLRVGDGKFPANIMQTDTISVVLDKAFLIPKPNKKEKEGFNTHKTVKPLALCKHILSLVALSDTAVVLDPFVGSGTTAVCAKELGISFIGIEQNKLHVDIAEQRITSAKRGTRNSTGIL